MVHSSERNWRDQSGMSLIELMIAMGLLMVVMSMAFSSFMDVTSNTARDSTKSYLTSRARGALELVTRSVRGEFMMFNTVADTPLGVNFDLDEDGQPVVRDGILYYIDANATSEIYQTSGGLVQTAGLDDANGDGMADVIGIGLVAMDTNGDGVQDFIDSNADGEADDLDGDGNADKLWNLMMVRFDSIDDVSTVALWKQGQALASGVYARTIDPDGEFDGPNILTFQFSAHNPTAMLYDTAAHGGNGNTDVEEDELGNMTSADGIVNEINEVAVIDSITVTLNVAELTRLAAGLKVVLSGDISSDLITPRGLALMRRNGIIGLPDAQFSSNLD